MPELSYRQVDLFVHGRGARPHRACARAPRPHLEFQLIEPRGDSELRITNYDLLQVHVVIPLVTCLSDGYASPKLI
jgi:hypothetical protein